MINGMLLPGDRMVSPKHDLAGADLRYQMPESFRREHHGVEMKLFQILRWLLFQRDIRIAVLRRHKAGVVVASGIGTEIAAAMGRNNLEARETIQRSLENQVLQGDGGVERISDRVRQPAVTLEALRQLRRALRMDEENRAKLFGLRPHRMKFLI